MAIVDRNWSALPVPYAMEYSDRAPKERYFDPDFYQMEVEMLWPRTWQMACRLEEIPEPARLRRVRDPRSVGRRGAHRRHGRAGVPECLPAPWREGRAGPRVVRGHVHLPLPRVVLRPGREEYVRHPLEDVHRAQPPAAGPEPRPGALRDVGRLRLDQPRQRDPVVAGVHRAVCHGHGRLEGGVAADREVVLVSPPGELEAGRRGVHGAVPRRGDAPPARHHGAGRVALGRGERSASRD